MTPPDPARLRIVMLGTRGVPAHYGGFETAVEEVGRRLAARGHKVHTVWVVPAVLWFAFGTCFSAFMLVFFEWAI